MSSISLYLAGCGLNQTLELCLAQNFPFKSQTSNICSSATEQEKEFLLNDHSRIADPTEVVEQGVEIRSP